MSILARVRLPPLIVVGDWLPMLKVSARKFGLQVHAFHAGVHVHVLGDGSRKVLFAMIAFEVSI